MAKRKRGDEPHPPTIVPATNGHIAKVVKINGGVDVKTHTHVIQVVTGSYERVLHGITASISDLSDTKTSVEFADTFLFNAHASAIRCLALSPLPEPGLSESQGVFLATGGSDERVNVYNLSTSPMAESDRVPLMPTIGNNKVSENPRNRELGTLLQHTSNITALHFPSRSKLLSASEDNTISISRIRDLNVVSTVKAPNPKVQGQPSGDTAPPGATPAGINDFAIHPSNKLMVSVGKGERCMRLWNLVTGKKAGVLNFDRNVLQSIKESKYSSGEGKKIRWSPDGNEFAVAFERGVVIFGEDSIAKQKILPQPLTKVHQISYHSIPNTTGKETAILAVSTEDGRIVFYNTNATTASEDKDASVPDAKELGQLGGKAASLSGRIKDFEILTFDTTSEDAKGDVAIITAGSDGSVRLWHLSLQNLMGTDKAKEGKPTQVGRLIGTYETGNRITCLKAFVMLPPIEEDDVGLSEFEGLTSEGEGLSSDSDDGEM